MKKPIVGVTVGTPIKPDKFAGKSAYDIARKYGYKGTEEEWIKSLVGKSAYDYAVMFGFEGTEEEWIKSLVGKSAYDYAKEGGYQGTEEEFPSDINPDNIKAEVAEIVKAEVPLVKTAEQPTFVNSVDEMTDTSKVYVMPDGYMWAYTPSSKYTLTADDFDEGEVEANGKLNAYATGGSRIATKELLPLSDIISISCPEPYEFFVYYFADATEDSYIGKTYWNSGVTNDVSIDEVTDGTISGAKYCRISLRDSTDVTVNLNGRIAEFMANIIIQGNTTNSKWNNTGHLYQVSDYEDRIISLEEASSQHIPNTALYGIQFTQSVMAADDFEIGGIIAIDGTDSNPSSDVGKIRARTKQVYCKVGHSISIVCNENTKWLVHFFNNDTWLGKTDMVSTSCEDVTQLYTSPNDVTHVRILLGYVSNAEVVDIADLLSNFIITRYIGEEPIIATRDWVKELLGGIENGTY